jgi:hypothetical protein
VKGGVLENLKKDPKSYFKYEIIALEKKKILEIPSTIVSFKDF